MSSSLVNEKCLHPKKPLYEDSGEGWDDLSMWLTFLFISFSFSWASLPHKRKITPPFILRRSITESIKIFQPILLWDPASDLFTVNEEVNKSTPWADHCARVPQL